MSAAVAKAYKLECDILKPLPSQVYEKGCGEIFLIQPHTVVLRCSLCTEEYQSCQEFLEHIFTHYYREGEKFLPRFTPEQQEGSELTEHSVKQSDDELTDVMDNAAGTSTTDEKEGDNGDFEEPMVDIDVLQPEGSFDEVSDQSSGEDSRVPLPRVKVPRMRSIKDGSNERSFKCDTCGITFRRKAHMEGHMVRHTGQKSFVCEQCDKAFYTRNELVSHKRHHSGERPFICKYCGARFTTSSWRLRHEKIHELRDSNRRPYKCDQCEKAFFDASQLKCHSVVHSRERNHICSVCNAAFMRRKNLIQHMKRHGTKREFVCNLCKKGFTDKTALQLHQQNKHEVVDPSIKAEAKTISGSHFSQHK